MADELEWDLRLLDAVAAVSNERAREYHASLQVAGFLPSLYLNVADDYRRLGDPMMAAEHLNRAREAVGALPEDGYGQMILAGIGNVEDALAAGCTEPLETHHS